MRTAVVRLLDGTLADGLGFVDEDGEPFRQYFYDVENCTSPAPERGETLT